MRRKYYLILPILLIVSPLFGDYYLSRGKQITLHPLKTVRSVKNRNIHYYRDNRGKEYGVTDQLIICAKQQKDIEAIAKRYPITFIRQLSKKLFLYRTTANAQTLQIANQISTERGIAFCHPNFLLKKEQRTADRYYTKEWHLKNREHIGADINVKEAWHYTKGEGVLTAVIDEGIDIDHEDLKANIAGFANYNDPDTNYPVSKSGKWHGTACAGLLAAVENDIGVVGVAPKAKLIAVRYSDSDVARDIQAFNDLMKEGVAVISNSWGSYTNLDAYNEIFKTLATEGRGGKGILIFFASGNDSKNLDEAGVDDESESPYVLSIAASTDRDEIASYSNYGSSVDFLAPGGTLSGELVTTDAMGEKGYTDWNYNFNFIGTSASAPIAAGVAALILSANPDLTRDEVIDIMKKSAEKIGDYPYINGRNDHAGYGRLDAGKAVKLARSYALKTKSASSKIENFAHVIYDSVLKFSN